jgi:prolipoprotein diacylglyceryltransferase
MAEQAYLPWNFLLLDFVFNTGEAKLRGFAVSDWGVDYLLGTVAGIAIGRKRQRSAEKQKKTLNVLMALGVLLLLLGIVVFSIVG